MKQVALLTSVALSVLPLVCGCGGNTAEPKPLPTAKSGGVATFEGGQPVTDVKVHLSPIEGKGYSPSGNLDAQGKFQLSTYAYGDGAPAGKYKAYFGTYMESFEVGVPTAAGSPAAAPMGPPKNPGTVVAKEYLSAESSPLTVEIPEGGNNNIEIKDIKRPAK